MTCPAWSHPPRLQPSLRPARPDETSRRAIIGPTPEPSEAPPLDIIFLLERLESLVATGKSLPLTRNAVVDRDAILDLVDQLRVAIPEEVRAAKRINAEGERIIEKAEDEAGRIVSRAQEQAAFLIGERGLLELAEAEGRKIIAAAEAAAEETRTGADDYAFGLLETLEAEVGKALAGVQKGIAVLDDRRAMLAAADMQAAGDADDSSDAEAWDDDLAEDDDRTNRR
ncbi:MAG: hypothetical protein HY264_10805 [Chloroflexi bacterium]|nr:hypothetical protein [Chloroflexota bacterium]